jgi:hypothetical protein
MVKPLDRLLPCRVQAERHKAQALAAQQRLPPAQRDNVTAVMAAGPLPATPPNPRLRPEALPAAGGRQALPGGPGGGVPAAGSPFALHYYAEQGAASVAQLQASAAWDAKYAPPQYGRRRWVVRTEPTTPRHAALQTCG